MKRAIVASDHAGFPLKEEAKAWLSQLGYAVEDAGCYSTEPCDYPFYAARLAKALKAKKAACGLMVCSTGIGSSIALNRFKGVRAALCTSEAMARQAREHVDANVLVLGSRVTPAAKAKRITRVFFSTKFSGAARHARRVRLLG
ncbi:MAG: ribose 5-phosphate isomerase B [Candidatus Micrarchaeia archaeon]